MYSAAVSTASITPPSHNEKGSHGLKSDVPAATSTLHVDNPSRIQALKDGGPTATRKLGVAIADALSRSDFCAAADGLELAAQANRMKVVIRAEQGGMTLGDTLLATPPTGRSSAAILSESLTPRAASALVATFAQAGDIAATAALLGALAGHAELALLASDASAVRAGADHPDILRLMLSKMPTPTRVQILASAHGALVTTMLKKHSAEDEALLESWIGDIVAAGDSHLAAHLLDESCNLMFIATNRRRLSPLLDQLVNLAGPSYSAAVTSLRTRSASFCQSRYPIKPG